jgi:hypothetical protein
MSGTLLSHGDGGGFIHCVICRGDAAGPCARCRNPVCGDCCVLVDGSAGKWALCLRCERREGHTMRSAWWSLSIWLVTPLLILIALLLVMNWAFPTGAP